MPTSQHKRLLLDGETRRLLREEISRRRREQELNSGRLAPGRSRRSSARR
jgi:hypothetical protein